MFSVKSGVQMAYSVLAGHRSHSALCFEALFMTLGLHVNLVCLVVFWFFVVLLVPYSLWDLSSPTRD